MIDRLSLRGFAVVVLAFLGQDPRPRSDAQLDPSTAFFTAPAERTLADLAGGPIDAATYARYLAMRVGTRHLEDLAFDLALARECAARGLASSAPVLARANAAQRLREGGREPDADLHARYLTEALRDLRIAALVHADRRIDDGAVRALFASRYGEGGVRLRIRHVLVAFEATRARLAAAGLPADREAVGAAARERADALRERSRSGTPFRDLLAESDERPPREVRDGKRYGEAFAGAARALEAGAVSAPVESELGWHLLELADRTVTRYEDVAEALRTELAAGRPSLSEERALRAALLAKYEYRPR